LLLIYLPTGSRDFSQLVVIKPLPVSITRDIPEPGSFEESRILGLESYDSGDYAGAQDHLRRALEIRPDDPEVTVYLGSALLLEGEPARAAERLRGPALASGRSQFHDEAAWLLANAYLLTGEPAGARSLLEALASGKGHRQPDAEALLEAMSAAR